MHVLLRIATTALTLVVGPRRLDRARRGDLRDEPIEFETRNIFKFETILVRLTSRGRCCLDLGWANPSTSVAPPAQRSLPTSPGARRTLPTPPPTCRTSSTTPPTCRASSTPSLSVSALSDRVGTPPATMNYGRVNEFLVLAEMCTIFTVSARQLSLVLWRGCAS